MKYCKHNMDESACSYCNGVYDRAVQEKQNKQHEKEEIAFEKSKYEELKSKFENFNEDWEEDEYQILYDQLKDLKFKSTKWRRAVYQVSTILGRTRKSIVWHYKHLFILPDHSKAGKNLLAFKKHQKIVV